MPHSTVSQPGGLPGGWPSHLVAGSRSDKTPHLPRSIRENRPVPCLARLCGTSMPPHVPPISLLVAPRVPLPVYPARSRTLAPVFRSLSNNQASRPRRAPPETPFPTPARIFRARISHVSIFQNVGSAHAHTSKTPRNPTPGLARETRAFSTFSTLCPAAIVFGAPSSIPRIGAKTISPLSRKPLATRRATNPRSTKGAASSRISPPRAPKNEKRASVPGGSPLYSRWSEVLALHGYRIRPAERWC
jgi:hypothetical protein